MPTTTHAAPMEIIRKAPFTLGKKELFLPTSFITLRRSAFLGPNQAKFRVPLSFSKLDLRDYLFHAYSVATLSVRSYVKQSKVVANNPRHVRPGSRRWFRPMAKKFMIVELERPFVWPEPLTEEELKTFNKVEMEASKEFEKTFNKASGSLKDAIEPTERMKSMREQAKALLKGTVKWRGSQGDILPSVKERGV